MAIVEATISLLSRCDVKSVDALFAFIALVFDLEAPRLGPLGLQ